MPEALAHVTRGDLIECIHYGDLAVCDATGKLIASVGDPSRRVYWRSSAKPIQALGVVQSGAADRFAFTARELSVCCASHSGSAEHVETVRGILAKIGLDETALQCGTHWSGDTAERNRLIKADASPSPVHNNCSGKHSGMLASCVAWGADPGSYLALDHPVQKRIYENLSVLSGVPVADIPCSVDGCGAPTHAMSLQAMATAFARLAWPDDMPEPIQQAAPRIVAATAAEPVMVSSRGSFNSLLLEAGMGRIVAKGGAEGLFVLGLTAHGLGIAVRTSDGNGRCHPPVVLHLLASLGCLERDLGEALADFVRPKITNCHGVTVGEIRPAFELA